MAGGSSSTSEGQDQLWQRIVGITIALAGSFFIGAAFIFQKKAHLANPNPDPNDHSYLKNSLWWTGMVMSMFFYILLLQCCL